MAYIDKTFTNIAVGSTSSATNSAYITSIKYGLCDDAAVSVLGDDWRTPTREECNELCENTTQDRVTVGGIECLKFTSLTSDAYIILPNTGYKNEAGEIYANGSGHYMTASLDSRSTNRHHAYDFNTMWYQPEAEDIIERHYGLAIRPVSTTKGTDLNLPSGLKWATMNVGASSPEEYGNYYAWGETSPKEVYTLANYKYYNAETGYTKYNRVDNKLLLDNTGNSIIKVYLGTTLLFSKIAQTKTDDAARAILGGNWRMPTVAETLTLADQCTLSGSGTATFTLTLKTTPTVGLNKLSFNVGGNGAAKNVGYWSSEKGTNNTYGLISLSSKGVAAAVNGNQRYNANRIRPVMTVTDISEVEGLSGMLITDENGNMTFWSSTDLIDPETGGAFFRWGETTGNLYQSGWTTEGYKWYDGTTYTKYNDIDGLKVLQLEYVDQ